MAIVPINNGCYTMEQQLNTDYHVKPIIYV